ncbi:MAG: hypothetical protein GC150_03725 [Rhizobiales bacterium]|nr:hypothetical protein [Hyphomicrobiales bacterium]
MQPLDDDTLALEQRNEPVSLAHALGAFLFEGGVAAVGHAASGPSADRRDDALGPSVPNPDADELLPRRLTLAGLDVAYLREAERALYSELRHSCAKCEHAEACHQDLAEGNGREVEYCRNTARIDALVVERLKGA